MQIWLGDGLDGQDDIDEANRKTLLELLCVIQCPLGLNECATAGHFWVLCGSFTLSPHWGGFSGFEGLVRIVNLG